MRGQTDPTLGLCTYRLAACMVRDTCKSATSEQLAYVEQRSQAMYVEGVGDGFAEMKRVFSRHEALQMREALSLCAACLAPPRTAAT